MRAIERWSRSDRRLLAAILLVAAALRLAWVLYAARPTKGLSDPAAYRIYGELLARGHGYRSIVTRSPTAFFPIGYPAALGGLFWVLFHTPLPDNLPRAVGVFQAVLGVGTVLMVGELGRRLFDRRVGLVAAIVTAVFPALVFHTGVVLTETLFDFLMVGSLLVLLRRPWQLGAIDRRTLLAFGALLGLSALVRPFSLLFLPALVLVAWTAGAGWRRALAQAGGATLVTALVLAPWTARNIRAMHSPVLISTNLGDTFCLSRHPGATGAFESGGDFCFGGYKDVPPDRIEVTRNRENFRRGLRFIRKHPADEARLEWWRVFYTVRDNHDSLAVAESNGSDPFLPRRARLLLGTLADGYFWAVGALALLALPVFARRGDPRRLFLLLATAALAASVPLFLYGYSRFLMPLLPLLAVMAAVPIVALGSGLSHWREGR